MSKKKKKRKQLQFVLTGIEGFYEEDTRTFYPREGFDYEKTYFGLYAAIQCDDGSVWICKAKKKASFCQLVEVLSSLPRE